MRTIGRKVTRLAVGVALVLGTMALAIAAENPVDSVRIAVVGDSTACNYPDSRPDRGWGMYLEQAFRPGSAEVENFAKAGRSTKTFLKQKHWDKVMKWDPDFVFIQFGHNDSHAPENPESTDAGTDFRVYLRRYVEDARKKGAVPILVTPMVRRTFHPDGTLDDNLKPYADAMKAVAREKGVPLIDLHTASWKLIEPLGAEAAQQFANKRSDRTHFNEKGARAMLGLILGELPAAVPSLGERLADPLLAPAAGE